MKKSFFLIYLLLLAFGLVYASNSLEATPGTILLPLADTKDKHKGTVSAPVSFIVIHGNEAMDYLSADAQIELVGIKGGAEVKQLIYSIDGSVPQAYSGPISLSFLADGQHTLHYYAEDKEGNREALNEYVFVLDRQAPHLQLEILEKAGKKQIKLGAVDDASGVKMLLYSVNGEEFQRYTGPIKLNKEEQNSLSIRCIDKVNNVIRWKKLEDSAGYALLK